MNEETILDVAHRAMTEAPDDDAARLRFYERLADSELFVLLKSESDGEKIQPQLFPFDSDTVALVFDRESRMAEFLGAPAPYAALSGRQVVQLFRDKGIGLAVNPGVPASETVLPASGLLWLAEMLEHAPKEAQAQLQEFSPPGRVPEALLSGLDIKLASTAGLARIAYLVGVTYEGGRTTHLLAFVDAIPEAEKALAVAAGEALTFSGIESGEMDVAFFAAGDPILTRLEKVGLRFDLPEPPMAQSVEIKAPGMDPNDPPILT